MLKIESKKFRASHHLLSSNILGWFCSDIGRSLRMTTNLTQKMKERFGDQNTSWRGEFLHRIWYISHEGEIYAVWCSKRGTHIEVTINERESFSEDFDPEYDKEKDRKYINFVIQLERELYPDLNL